MHQMMNSLMFVQNTMQNMLHKFKTSIAKRQYTVTVMKYEKGANGHLEIEYILENNKGVKVQVISESLDRAVWQDIQIEMKARENAERPAAM